MISIELCLLLPLLLLVPLVTLKRNRRGPARLPGPPRWPIVGSYFWIKFPFRTWLMQATGRYGEIFAFDLAGRTWVSLNNFSVIHEALVDNAVALSSRQRSIWSEKFFGGYGIALAEGPVWAKHRKSLVHLMHQYGFNSIRLERTVKLQLDEVLGQLDGAAVSSELFSTISTGVLLQLMFGLRRADYLELESLMQSAQTVVQADVYSGIGGAILLPLLSRWPGLLSRMSKFKKSKDSIQSLLGMVEKQVQLAKETNNDEAAGAEVETFVQAMVEHYDEADSSSICLAVSVFDLVIGGSDTTACTMKWLFLILATHPQFQQQLAERIDAVLDNRAATLEDRRLLGEVEATIEEILRLYPPLPTAIVHRADRAVTVNGYVIPKDAWVLPNLRAAHRDPKIFKYPDEFRPSRFLGSDGRFQPSEQILPFSTGWRTCPGMLMAKAKLFLIVTELLRRYSIRLSADDKGRLDEIVQGSAGLICAPQLYTLILEDRHK